MSEETTEKKKRYPSVETQAKMLRKHIVQVNGIMSELRQFHGIELEVSLDEDNEIVLGEIKLVKTL